MAKEEKQEQEAQEPKAVSFTEAPASFNVKAVSPQGFDIMLTLRDSDTANLMARVEGALDWLVKQKFTPTPQRYGGGNANASGQQAGGNGGEPETKVCPLHHVAMKRRTGKGGDTWYSHKAVNPDTNEEYWCKGGAK